MSGELRAVRGMKDILPAEAARWQKIEQGFRAIVERYGYGEVRTPLIEPTELFVREIGQDTDVVAKEMYSFERHDDRLTVRPEGTAGCARAYVQHNVAAHEPVSRWYYLGPMFRAERPAKGRYRQFHQAGCEIYGDPSLACEAEMIDMCCEIVRALGVGDFVVRVNSIGSGSSRARYRDALTGYFEPHRAELSEDSQRRLAQNPLRILDSKDPRDQALVAAAPSVLDALAEVDRQRFDALRALLDRLGVAYAVDPKLVRGLDYYTGTLFELKITSGALGAQDALLGGGRYDAMIADLGGKQPVPAIGFAMGLERVLEVTAKDEAVPGPQCYFAPAGLAIEEALLLAKLLRAEGICCEVDGRGQSFKAMLRRADHLGARLALILGADEHEKGEVTVKDLGRHEQTRVPAADLARAVKAALGRSAASPAAAAAPAEPTAPTPEKAKGAG